MDVLVIFVVGGHVINGPCGLECNAHFTPLFKLRVIYRTRVAVAFQWDDSDHTLSPGLSISLL